MCVCWRVGKGWRRQREGDREGEMKGEWWRVEGIVVLKILILIWIFDINMNETSDLKGILRETNDK